MARLPKPFVIEKRTDSKTFRLTLNYTSGLPERVCAEWRWRSFQDFLDELAHYRNPKTKSGKVDDSVTEAGAIALIAYLKKKLAEGGAMRVKAEDITKIQRRIDWEIAENRRDFGEFSGIYREAVL